MQRGGLALWGHCYEEGSLSLPYLAFVEAIRSYVQSVPAETVLRLLGSDGPDVARISQRLDALLASGDVDGSGECSADRVA